MYSREFGRRDRVRVSPGNRRQLVTVQRCCESPVQLVILLGSYRPRLQLELGIAELAHFGQIQTFEFRLAPNPLADHRIDQPG